MAKHVHLVLDLDTGDITHLALPGVGTSGAGTGTAILALGAGSIGSSTTTRYLFPFYSEQLAEVNEFGFESPRSGIIKNLRVRHNKPKGNGNNIVYTVRVAGSDSSVSVTLASTSTSGNDIINTVSVSAGDLISIKVEKSSGVSSSPRNVIATFEFE
jgi:hypothetical protein